MRSDARKRLERHAAEQDATLAGIPWGEDLERDCRELRRLESWGLYAPGHHDATCTLDHATGGES